MGKQRGKQTIGTQALHNISGSKGNQTMKFGQLLEYKMRNIFVEIYTKCGGETSQTLFLRTKIEQILDQ